MVQRSDSSLTSDLAEQGRAAAHKRCAPPPGRLEPDARAAADHDHGLPEQLWRMACRSDCGLGGHRSSSLQTGAGFSPGRLFHPWKGEKSPASQASRASPCPGPLKAELFAALLAHHVLRVPVRPVQVPLARPRLVLPVRGLRAPQGLRQVARRRVRRVAGHTPGEPRRDLLQQPAVAVRVAERHERRVTAPLRIGAARPCFGVEAVVAAAGVMEDLARVDPLSDELVARRLDVGDDKVEKPNDSDGATTALLRLACGERPLCCVCSGMETTPSRSDRSEVAPAGGPPKAGHGPCV